MKVLLSILLMVGVVSADTGISMSYRSTPMKLSVERKDTFYRTMETASVNIYFDDLLRAHDEGRSAHTEVVYYVRRHASIDNEHPIGQIWYEEVDLKGVSRNEYNTLNHKKPGMDGYIYEKYVLVPNKLRNDWLPDVINPAKGAGYIFGLNMNIGTVSGLVDMYSTDLYLGKRITLFPHLFHVYFKTGASVMLTRWDLDYFDYRFNNTQMGVMGNIGTQVQILKGVKLFVEAEWRLYGPYISQESTSELEMVNKMPFWDKDFVLDSSNKEESVRGIVRESLRFGLRFSF